MVLSSALLSFPFFTLKSSLRGGLATYLWALGTSFILSFSSSKSLSCLINSSVPQNICPFNVSHGDFLLIPSITNLLYFSTATLFLPANCESTQSIVKKEGLFANQ